MTLAGLDPPHPVASNATAQTSAISPELRRGEGKRRTITTGTWGGPARGNRARPALESARMLIPARSETAIAARMDRASAVRRIPLELWLLAGVLLVGATLRFATLSSQSFWFDEAQAAHELHLSFGAMVSTMVAHETNPPLYFVLGWLWAKVFGTSEAGLRSLSAVAGIALIPVVYLCGRELVSRRAGLLAAALTALSPFMIWYSQEAREYMLLALLCAASLLFFARALTEPHRGNIVWWAVFSALAVLTHFFAGFLVAPEAIWLMYVSRSRASVVASAAVALVQASLLPLLFSHASNSLLGFIHATPLGMRIKQVPVAFGLGTLYHSSIVDYGLYGAAVLAAVLIVLLVVGAGTRELRGAGIAAALAAVVLIAPLLVALAGEDYYISRALIPAWVPLAIVIGAACATARLRAAGVALAAVVLGGFVYAQLKIDANPVYQRPDWRGVADALGSAAGARAIVAYDGGLSTDPLATYLPRVPWKESGRGPVAVSEVDVVGSTWQTPGNALPPGTRLIGRKTVDQFLVVRFALNPSWQLTPAQIGARAQLLLAPAPAAPAVLVQHAAP
jgi:mannosyltransferase